MTPRLAAALLAPLLVAASAATELRFQDDPALPQYGTLSVALPPAVTAALAAAPLDRAAAAEVLALTVVDGETDDLPPVYGAHRVDDGALVFTPRFPLATGLALHARFDGDALARHLPAAAGLGVVEATFRTRSADVAPATRVVAVEPLAPVVPANLFRVYLHFSAPMRAHDVARHVRVRDAAGEAVTLPFVEVREGLWDRERRRLTLVFHPGRLKRGVAPNAALGTPLVAGGRYSLEVDADLRDAAGRPLAAPFRHDFTVGPADRTSPDPAAWNLALPHAGGREPLVVTADEALDRALLRRMVRLETAAGALVAGTVDTAADGRTWRLVPAAPWSVGTYRLVVDPALEDLAGNRVDRRFEEAVGSARAAGAAVVRTVEIQAVTIAGE